MKLRHILAFLTIIEWFCVVLIFILSYYLQEAGLYLLLVFPGTFETMKIVILFDHINLPLG